MAASVANNICFAKVICGDGQKVFAYGPRMPPPKARAKSESYRRSGELIAAARETMGYTQEKLAGLLGISRQRLQHWEAGAAMPRPAEMRKLGDELDLTIDEITAGQHLPAKPSPAQQSLELTPNGRTIGRIWDDLPTAGQNYIAEQLAAMLRFQAEDRDMAAYVFNTPSGDVMKRLKEHEKMLELAQDKARRKEKAK